jgi:hypothetical protein
VLFEQQDGHIGGRKLVVARGTRPHEHNAYNDCHFTALGFTTANGAPVMCCVIVAAKTLTAFEASGINYLIKDLLMDGALEENATKDEFTNGCYILFPMGPAGDFEGKDVPCFVSCSENGSITSHLLAIMLKSMDDLELFPRGALLPDTFLLLD